jgi:glucokinase
MQKPYAIGIDLGGTNLRVAIVSRSGEIIAKQKLPSGEKLDLVLTSTIGEMMSGEIAGIGIGVAGLLDRDTRRVIVSPNLTAIESLDVVSLLRERFGVPVMLENDANVAALGERWMGAGRDFPSLVLLTLGTGVGGGIIHNGQLLDVAAEVGHMSIIANGVKCSCGNYGCLESYASGRAMLGFAVTALEHGTDSILRGLHQGNIYKLTPEDIYTAALDGDNLSRDVLREAGRYLGVGISNAINVFSPQAVILSGGLIGAWNIYISEAIKEASRRTFRSLFDKTRILPAALGDNAGITGAAFLLFSSLAPQQAG